MTSQVLILKIHCSLSANQKRDSEFNVHCIIKKVIAAYLNGFSNYRRMVFLFWNIFVSFRDIDAFVLCKLGKLDGIIRFATKMVNY